MPLPLSLSSRRAWIEIRCCFDKLVKVMSLSSRRAWIEIWVSEHLPEVTSGRSPHGERGLKYQQQVQHLCNQRRSPHGERGLKFDYPVFKLNYDTSLSSRRAWIEIKKVISHSLHNMVALLTESVD